MWQLHCIHLGPILFRLVNLSEGNCLIWRLLRISDSGSEIHVSVQPADTLSRCEWKLCEMCVTQKHIPHKSSRSISRDTFLWWIMILVWMGVCLHRIALSKRLLSSSSRLGRLLSTALAKASCVHWVDNCLLFWLCGGASVCLTGLPGQMPSVMYHTSSTKQSRESPWLARSRLDAGSFSSVWATGWKDSRRTEILKKLYLKVPAANPSVWADFHPEGMRKEKCLHFTFCYHGYLNIRSWFHEISSCQHHFSSRMPLNYCRRSVCIKLV